MKRFVSAFAVCSLALAVSLTSAKTYTGAYTFVRTDGTDLVLSRPVQSVATEFKFEIDSNTKIIIDGKPAKAEDLKPGDKTAHAISSKADPADATKKILIEADFNRGASAASQPSR